MTTTKITNLTALNARAIAETITDTRVTTTKTTATFDMTPAEAIALVGRTIDALDGGNAHPRGSLHAVLRKLNAVVETPEAPAATPVPAEPEATETTVNVVTHTGTVHTAYRTTKGKRTILMPGCDRFGNPAKYHFLADTTDAVTCKKCAKATAAPVADEFPTMAITPEQFAQDFADEITAIITNTAEESTMTDTTAPVTADDATDTINGVTVTPTMRAVYDAMTARDASDCTAKDLEDVTGIILAKVRAALQALKAAGAVASTDQAKPGQPIMWWLTPADDRQADEAAMDADIAAGADIDAAVEATGHLPGNDVTTDTVTDADDAPATDTPDAPADVVDAPTAPAKPKRVRLLVAYPNDPAPSADAPKLGKAMDRVLAWLEANPGDHPIADIAAGLDTKWTADVLKTCRRLAAKDARVTQVADAKKATFTFTPAADDTADAEA